MNIFNRDPAGSITRSIGKIIEGLVLSGGLVLLAGCPSGGGTTKPAPVAPIPGKGTGEPKIAVGDSPLSVTLNENGPETLVTLPYKGQEGAVPTSCTVNSLSMVTVTRPCACSEGVCRVGVQPTPKVFGNGSFEFRLSDQSGQKEILSDIGKASVKVLEVTLSIYSGDKQGGTVGMDLPAPIVVLVQNSDKVPVSGVKIFWDVEKKDKKGWTEERSGKISPYSEDTDGDGLAQCTWTLGTVVYASQKVNASAFYSSKEIYKETLGGTFSAFAKPGEIAQLSFRSFDTVLPDVPGVYNMYRGPSVAWLAFDKKSEKAGVPLGVGSDGEGLWVFALDKYGNHTTVRDGGVDVALSLREKPKGAAFLGASTNKMVNEDLEYLGYKWKQGVAKFKDVKVNKAGEYKLGASNPGGPEFNTLLIWLYNFTVSPGDATKLAFTAQPGGGAAGVTWVSQPVVAVQDDYGNTVTSDRDPFSKANVSLAIGTDPSLPPPATLSGGATSLNADEGVATFSGFNINKAGNGYTLKASSTGLKPATSSTFNIAP